MSTANPYAGSSRGPLDPVARPAGASLAGIALQAAATASTLAYLKLRYDTTLANNGNASCVAVALLAAEALAAIRALCHLGPFNLRSREEYADTDALLAANSYNGCHMRILIPCYSESLDLVSATAIAAAAADLPAGMQRTIYLCDDGADPLKKQWCESCDRNRTLGCDVRWISGRSKSVPGNGKSLNLNHALRQIYGSHAVPDDCGRGVPSPGWADIPDTEFIAGLDADMVASPTFFTELTSKLRTPRDAIAQSAQAFWNYDPEADVTDNAQLVKYEICDSQVRAGGGVRCNGSGWVCRARAMAHTGWWRVDTTGEGQAMGIALERLGYKGYYSMKTLQVGEVPCTLGDTFVQKTRYAQNFWKNVFGRGGILYDRTLSFGKRLTGQGLLRDSLTPLYVPIMIAAPVLALLLPSLADRPSRIIGWSPRLPFTWLIQYTLLQSITLFHVARTALAPEHQRKQKACVRSLAASWLTNLTSTHAFWLATAVAAFNVARAEVKGSLLEFVVTPKTQGAREDGGDHKAAPTTPRRRPSVGLRMHRASIERTASLSHAMLLHIKGAASGEGQQPGTAAACTDAPVPVPPLSAFTDVAVPGHDKGGATGNQQATLMKASLSGSDSAVDWSGALAARRRSALRAQAKRLRRWTSSLRVARKPIPVCPDVKGGATACVEEEAVPWKHLWVHALGGGLSLLACVAGVTKTALAPSDVLTSSPQLIAFTAWAFVNAVPPALLFVRAVKGDGPTLKKWCAVAPRAVFGVAGMALAGVVFASAP